MRTAIALAALLAMTGPLAAKDALLARFEGTWTGTGTVQLGHDAQPERVLCKITSTLIENGNALQQTGRCGVTSSTSPVNGIIRAAGGGRYTGQLQSLAATGSANISGSGSGGVLTMTVKFVDSATGMDAESTTRLEATGSGYRLKSRRKASGGAGAYSESDITFTR